MIEIKTNFLELIGNKNWRLVKLSLNELDANDVVRVLQDAQKREKIILFRLLTRERKKKVFKLLSPSDQIEFVRALGGRPHKVANLLNDIKPDDRTTFFKELPKHVAQPLIQLLSPEEREITNVLLSYPKNSVGRLMTPEFVAIKPGFSVASSFEYIRNNGRDSETLNVIFIVDHAGKMIGDIRIGELLLAAPQQFVEELMDYRFVVLNAMDDQETAVKLFKKYDRVALPVVNKEGVLLGIVTFDDIMDVEEQESTEDFHKFGSIQSAISDPIKAKIFDLYKNRVVWLFVLVFMNVFSGEAMSNFEDVIQSYVPLVFFLPLLIDSGGNAGSQSATLMIRYLAVGGVKLNDWHKLVGKEFIVSFFLGITMAIGVAAVASFRAPEIVVVVGISMILMVMIGSLIGLLLPFVFTKLNLDPATASAPLVTSLSDICGVIIYFSIAAWFFGF
ncbi:Magnesium transporter MgtE [Arenibacter antarcticus]|uniref:Magnesium transporter MgtE n=1 Tax=Arenibacter antarcticus TaxID=2040469 RepID=A0ABW5VEX7_9FLAO|nr:magnesium transporter [Arenibacter sp. H213]MCM4168109.1 magnesium transporter [Arenibacter sp. H213]